MAKIIVGFGCVDRGGNHLKTETSRSGQSAELATSSSDLVRALDFVWCKVLEGAVNYMLFHGKIVHTVTACL